MEDVGIIYGHLVHFTVFCYISWAFGIVCGNLVYFSPIFLFCTKKNLATLAQSKQSPGGRIFAQSGHPGQDRAPRKT
jgi:hypothetical protein